jgi:phosphatidylinositol-bisphosphatase
LTIADGEFQLASRQLVGMLLVVIAKTSLKQCFQDLETCTVGTGIMGVLVRLLPDVLT